MLCLSETLWLLSHESVMFGTLGAQPISDTWELFCTSSLVHELPSEHFILLQGIHLSSCSLIHHTFFVPNFIPIMVKIPLPRQSSCATHPFFLISTLFPPLPTNHSLLLVVENIRFFFIQLLSTFISHLT